MPRTSYRPPSRPRVLITPNRSIPNPETEQLPSLLPPTSLGVATTLDHSHPFVPLSGPVGGIGPAGIPIPTGVQVGNSNTVTHTIDEELEDDGDEEDGGELENDTTMADLRDGVGEGDGDGDPDLKGRALESLWGHSETMALITTVRDNYDAIRKKQRNKLTTVWLPNIAMKLTEMGFTKTAEQCHVKWKNLLHKYRELKEQSLRARGRLGLDPPKMWQYYKAIDEIVGKSPPALNSRFVMYVPPKGPTPSFYTPAVPTLAARPYPEPATTTTPYYPYVNPTTAVNTAATAAATFDALSSFDATAATFKRTQDDGLFAVVSEKLDKVIYLLERQLELQETLAGIKRPRFDGGLEDGDSTETENN